MSEARRMSGARAGARGFAACACARGAVTLEFLIAFVPLFILFLGIVQLALLAAARLVVRHAAVTAARAAVVVLDDDPRHYAGEPRGAIASANAGAASGVELDVAAVLRGEPGPSGAESARNGSRMAAIRSAALLPLAAIAPGVQTMMRLSGGERRTSVALAIGDAPLSRLALGLLGWVPLATAVTLPVVPGAPDLRADATGAEQIVVRVTHLVPCTVPLAGALLCDRLAWSAERGQLIAQGADADTEAALAELRHAPFAFGQQGLAASALRFAVLRAEASMPAQAAPYAYRSELSP